MSLSDLRQIIQLEVERLSAAKPPVIEYVEKVPELKPESVGNGVFYCRQSSVHKLLNCSLYCVVFVASDG